MLDELSMCSFFSVKFVLGLCVVCRAGHRVYETVRCPSRLPTAAACGKFAAVGLVDRRYQSIAVCPGARAQQKRVVPRFQHTYVAAHRLVRSGRLHIGPEEREGKGGEQKWRDLAVRYSSVLSWVAD